MEQLFKTKPNYVKNGFSFSNEHFSIEPGIKMSFGHNSVRKNFSLSACFCWDSRLSVSELGQNFKFGGTNGYGDSYLEFLCGHFEVMRVHDAGRAVQAHSREGLGYSYMIGLGRNSRLFGHVSGLLFCLDVE